jgi:intracellular septation protein
MTQSPATTLSPKKRKIVRGVVNMAGLVVFLVAFLITRDVVKATWGLVIGSAVGLAVGWIGERRIAPLPLVAGGAALVFGALTLIFHDARFVKMKPTFLNLAFATFLLGGSLARRNPLKMLLDEALELPDAAWRTLTVRYGLYFVFIAALNEAVWRTQPDRIWVWFRFPGLLILAFLFSLTQLPLMMRHSSPETSSPPPPPAD